jgi:eukaryotic-like serine/threonine-protein kinase
MAESPAAGSRKIVAMRAGVHVFGNDEESRVLMQERLVVLSRVMFLAFIVLIVGMLGLYEVEKVSPPRGQTQIYVISVVGLTLLTIIWRVLLVRRKLSLRMLNAIDLVYAFGTGLIFASAAYWSGFTRATSGWVNLLWACFTVFLRTIIIPSTASRTTVAGALLFLPVVSAATALSFEDGAAMREDLPQSAFLTGAVLVAGVVIVLATIGSRLIYGLRQQASEAMRLGQYTLGEKIGEGGNGSVYRAHHALLRRPTAIKVVLPEKVGAITLQRFEREVQAMSQLTHWNTVAVYDYGHSPSGVFYYAMEYLDGINLETLVIEHGLLPADRVIKILTQVCAALAEAHRRGIIHRDIKPANIILCERGDVPDVVKVVDFGLAKEIDREASPQDTTHTILGTPAYIAPEQVTDPASIGAGADLYAVGAVGYFLLTGRRVFEAKTTVEMCILHVTATPKPPSLMTTKRIPPELEQIVLRCLAKSPSDRPASAGELAKLLREVPMTGDWGESGAMQWWSDFRRLPKQAASSAPTLTITVDLEGRGPAPN